MRRIAALVAALALAASASAQSIGAPPDWLQELSLTKTQQQAVFEIFYEQAPLVRERLQAARDAHEALELLAADARLNGARAHALEEARSRALEDVSALRLQAMLRVYELLSVEQRAQVVRLHGDE
jgi:Spy/CpxP family protein refolding chaperone